MTTIKLFYDEIEKLGFSLKSILPFFYGKKQKRGEGTLSRNQQIRMTASTGKVNAPTLAYQTVYGKDPDQFLVGRTSAPKKIWNGLSVDEGLKDEWLENLNSLPIEMRSTEEGKGGDRPAFVVFRMPEGKDKLHTKMVKELGNEPGIFVKSDIGMDNRPRICVAGTVEKDKEGWKNWWEGLPSKIDGAYNRVAN